MPHPPRPAAPRLAAWAALAAGVGLGGCETVRPAADRPDPTARGAEPAATAAPGPGKHSARRGHYVYYSDFPLDAGHPLLAELDTLPDQVYGELGLPPATGVIQVFLFDTQERYDRYMRAKHPDLPSRPAYFVRQPRLGGGPADLMVYTWMGDHLRTNLRHELTHALLNAVLKDVPLWLDEGLAGYFELPPDQEGVNPQHLEVLRRGPFQPDLGGLEKRTDVAQMQRPEYREAWAWVHLMLRGDPAAGAVLRDYLQALRTTPRPKPDLQTRLREVLPDPEQALADHLGRVAAPRAAARR